MSALSIEVPFPVFQDRDGQPLDNGYIWLGVANLNPQTNPVVAYFDAALTIVAPQPLRTINGYVSRAGTPAQIYVDAVNFSILVQDSKGSMVYTFADGTGIGPDSCNVTYDPPFTGGVPYPVCEKLAQTVSIMDFGATGDGVTDDAPALRAAMAALNGLGGGELFVPSGTFLLNSLVVYPGGTNKCFSPLYPNISIRGVGGQSIFKAGNNTLNSQQSSMFFDFVSTSDVDFFKFDSLTFDHNGTNNLYPASGYYPMQAISINTTAGAGDFIKFIEVKNCFFLDNAGRNSITIVDQDLSTSQEYIRMVNITNNMFNNFGYTVGNGANSNNNDHSALYIQAQECVINNNIFSNDYFDQNTTDVAAAFDHHAVYCTFNDNVIYNTTYSIAHQNSVVSTIWNQISNNIARTACFYKWFDGAGGGKGNNVFSNNSIQWLTSSGMPNACFDFFAAEVSDPAASPQASTIIEGNLIEQIGSQFTGLTNSAIDIKRVDNLTIQNNVINGAPGRGIYYRPSGRLNYVNIQNNTIQAYGIGNVAGTKVGVEFDLTAAAITDYWLTAVVKDNQFRRGLSGVTIEAGVKFNGKFASLTIMDNQYQNVGTQNTTTLLDATSYQIEGNSQVAFLPAANLSTDPNVLDDYEEGTWTPTITNQTDCTATPSASRYTKVGNLVTVNTHVTITGAGAGSPRFDFSLPFAPISSNGIAGFGSGFPFGINWQCNASTSPTVRCNAMSTSASLHDFNLILSYQTAS
jgi:hypothetical protein